MKLKIFLTSPKSWLAFIFFVVISFFTQLVFIFFFFIFSINWLFSLYKFNNGKIKEIKPIKYQVEGDAFIIFFFNESIVKPHLFSFCVMYINLKRLKTGVKTSKINFIAHYIFNFFVKLITGVSKTVIKNSFNWSLKFSNYNSNLGLQIYFFNIVAENYIDLLHIEKMRIYSKKDSKFNFNPPKINYFSNNIKTFITNNSEAMKEAKIIEMSSPLLKFIEVLKIYTIRMEVTVPENKIPHDTNIISINKDKELVILVNQTTKSDITIGQEKTKIQNPFYYRFVGNNKELYSTIPQYTKTKNIKMFQRVYDLNSAKEVAEQIQLNPVINAFNLALKRHGIMAIIDEYKNYKLYNTKETLITTCLNNNVKLNSGFDLELNDNVKSVAVDISIFEEETFKKLKPEIQQALFFTSLEAFKPDYLEYLDKLTSTDNNQQLLKDLNNFNDYDKFQ